MREVDRGGCRCSLRVDALGVHVPLAEGLESRNGLCAQPQKSVAVLTTIGMERTLGEAERGVDTGEVLNDVPSTTARSRKKNNETYHRCSGCF